MGLLAKPGAKMDRRDSVMGASSNPACSCLFPSLLAMLVLQVLLWEQFEGKVQAGRKPTESGWIARQHTSVSILQFLLVLIENRLQGSSACRERDLRGLAWAGMSG